MMLLDDTQLVLAARGGDKQAFSSLFERHADAVHAYAFRRLHGAEFAEEVVSKTFLDAWRQRERLVEVDGNALPWLFGIARNHIRRHWRSSSRRKAAQARVNALAQRVPATDHAEALVNDTDTAQRLTDTLAALERLSAEDRELITLAAWERLSYAEMAEATGLPIGTVKSRISRARTQLRRLTGDAS